MTRTWNITKSTTVLLTMLLLCASPSVFAGFLKIELSCENPGTGTPGYWMNHPEAWPVDEITIGGVTYTQAEALALMWLPTKGDKTLTMFPAVVAAILNEEIGNSNECMVEVCGEELSIRIVRGLAESWMRGHPPLSGVKASSDAWQECGDLPDLPAGEAMYEALDDYNNGKLCVPSRDALEEEIELELELETEVEID